MPVFDSVVRRKMEMKGQIRNDVAGSVSWLGAHSSQGCHVPNYRIARVPWVPRTHFHICYTGATFTIVAFLGLPDTRVSLVGANGGFPREWSAPSFQSTTVIPSSATGLSRFWFGAASTTA